MKDQINRKVKVYGRKRIPQTRQSDEIKMTKMMRPSISMLKLRRVHRSSAVGCFELYSITFNLKATSKLLFRDDPGFSYETCSSN